MDIWIQCPNQCRFRAPEHSRNSTVRCPNCQAELAVPGKPHRQSKRFEAQFLSQRRPVPESLHFADSLRSPEILEPPPIKLLSASQARSSGTTTSPDSMVRVKNQARQRLLDRRRFARAMGAGMLVLALIVLLPAILVWQNANMAGEESFFCPRWAGVSGLVALLHFFQAILLFMVPDWSTLKANSFYLLAWVCLLGIISTALSLPVSANLLQTWLQLPELQRSPGTLWTLAMLCLHLMISYWSYREYAVWRRTEELLEQLFPASLAR